MGNSVSKKNSSTKPKRSSAKADIYVIGYNGKGQLGVDNRRNVYKLTLWNKTNPHKSIKQIYCTYDSTIFIDTSDRYWVSGNNVYGKLGVSDLNRAYVVKPTLLKYFASNNIEISKICCSMDIETNTCWISNKMELYIQDSHKPIPRIVSNIYQVLDVRRNMALCKPSSNFLSIFKYWMRTLINILYIPTDIINTIKVFHETNELYFISKYDYDKDIKTSRIEAFNYKHIMKIGSGKCGKNKKDLLFALDIDNIMYSYSHFDDNEAVKIDYYVRNKIIIKDFECGEGHILTIDNEKNIYSWGDNSLLQCGHNENKYYDEPKLIELLKGTKIIEIKCGFKHSYIRTESNDHYLSGCDKHNECGLGGSNDQHSMQKLKRINNTFIKLTNLKEIKDVYVGQCNTIIIAAM